MRDAFAAAILPVAPPLRSIAASNPESMSAVQFIVEGGQRLSGSIRPAGNKNAALPIVAATLLTEQPVQLHNVPRIRDIETLVELVRTTGAECEWNGPNSLRVHAKSVQAADLDPTNKSVPIPNIKSLLKNAALGFKDVEAISNIAGGLAQAVG